MKFITICQFFLTIFLIFLLGPKLVIAQESLYKFRDFRVKLERFPPDENPYTCIQINMDGKCTYSKSIKGESITLDKFHDFTVTVSQLEYLYIRIMRNHFFDISKEFGDPNLKKGIITRITVKLNNQMHSVTMYDVHYLAVDQVVDAVLDLTPEHIREDFKRGKIDFSEVKLP